MSDAPIITAASVRRLDERLIDKIAAGEVVERPASAVKELVENALDAGARAIDVTVEAGGTALIRVADDGHGIRVEELPLAVQRHCTSKLVDAAGLSAILTMGFRGEALPSIGAVARLSVVSRHRDGDAAGITVAGGRVGEVEPAARAVGTTVEVRDLFYATPARLKFLKSERAEAGAVSDTVKRLALSAPHVAFTLTLNGRRQEFPAGTPRQRARDVLGADFADEAIDLDIERHGVRLVGHLGLPTSGRASSQYTYAFVNNRVVRDKLIAQAMRAGYQDVMARDRHPVAILWLTIDPAAVDVNVHPAKADVRFRDANAVRGLIVTAFRRALAEAPPTASHSVATAALAALSARRPSSSLVETDDAPAHAPQGFAAPATPFTARSSPSYTARPSFPPRGRAFHSAPPAPRTAAPAPGEWVPDDPADAPDGSAHPLGAAVAQVHGNYILAQSAHGLVVVDQHAAHERIVYEALKASAATREPAAQGLLIPEVVELPAEDVDRLAEHAETFARLGLTLEPFGAGAVVVRETPAALGTFDIAKLVKTLADEIADWGAAGALEARLDHAAATMACYGSVRSGRALKVEEMNALLRQIETTPSAGQCNHGRPTFVSLSLAEIEKLFERR
ncbi:DNA mismatch repair endonuclease MutL [Acuticoccus sp. I52.16.1]|uniref:DNA mismatch repair endonuclease MutL n=1 Tax=Acuticoccus sp. I52.16.1 TaxID=2928472 RepID=UPI001FD181D7|nr:DNA mismatch repair endonuclease MutL [Acuticoccus sp. I52.16.1]UOM32827.1 DNA mismatch repair endonuclease MutL [Acuticoccus sp. I52.16.1]